ncbi:MAG: magnesium transporter [Clostridiales bacterium]|nr:magnesium transporter [Clostridiales bacterium]
MDENTKLFEELLLLLENREFRQLREALTELNKADAAEFLETLPEKQMLIVFRTLHKETAADVFSYLSPELQEKLITTITDREASAIIDELAVDDAVDALDELPANVVQRLLRYTSPETRQTINQFLNYPEFSAGSIMTSEFVHLKKEMTVQQAFERIRKVGLDSETVYTCYVTDANRRIEGVVTVRALFLASLETKIEEIMDKEVIYAHTSDNQEEAAQIISKYDFLSLPVVDQEDRLVGIITVDDIIDVIQEENTEDFEKMAAMRPSQTTYLKTSVLEMARNRVPWLLVLMVSATFTGGILSNFEHAISLMPILVTFIPMLMDTGGNSGAQSSTMIIRGLALGEVANKDLPRILWKEVRVSLCTGACLIIVNYARLLIIGSNNIAVNMTISIALLVTVTVANSLGGLLPVLAKNLKVDPAIMASPMITTIVDACALAVYFNLARVLLGL